MDARNFRVKAATWNLHTAFTANPSQVTLSNGDLEACAGRINFSRKPN